MLAALSPQGLIVTVSPLATPALGEVIDFCGWPVLLQATPRQIHREVLLRVPKTSLFWLDDDRYVGTTAELLSWLGKREPAVRRIAISYRLPSNVEVAVRCAGVHLYLAAEDDLRSMLHAAIAPWLHCPDRPAAAARVPSSAVPSHGRSRASPHNSLHVSGPP